MAINIKDISYEKKVLKPWGEELIYTPENLNYTLKSIKINANKKLSLQSHDQKIETFILVTGRANLHLGTSPESVQIFEMENRKSYSIPINTVHRLEGITDCEIIEASTPETGNTTRYQDDYNRPDETEEIRNLPNRGWSPNQN